jgi:hypothetical protein
VGAIGLTAAATAAIVTASSTQAKAASVMAIAAKLTAALAVTAGGVAATWSYVNHSQEPAPVSAPAPVKVNQVTESERAKAPSAPVVVSPEEVKLEEEAPAAKRAPRFAKPEAEKEPAKDEQTPADLEAEMKLIRGADAALRAGRSSEALGLLAQHQAEHPRASLAHEREGLRTIAQCQVGVAGSRASAERFISRSPRSPLAARLRSACKINE